MRASLHAATNNIKSNLSKLVRADVGLKHEDDRKTYLTRGLHNIRPFPSHFEERYVSLILSYKTTNLYSESTISWVRTHLDNSM